MAKILIIHASPDNYDGHKRDFLEKYSVDQLVYANLDQDLKYDNELVIIEDFPQALNCFEQLRRKGVIVPIILFQNSGYILPEIIKAQKFGRAYFVESGQNQKLEQLVARIINVQNEIDDLLNLYLNGNSEKIKKLEKDLTLLAKVNYDILMFGEPGCGKKQIVSWLHKQSYQSCRELMELNLNNFSGDDYEVHIWSALKEVYQKYQTELPGMQQPLYSTLYLKGIENKDILFIISVLEWLHEKREAIKDKYGNTIRIVVAIENWDLFQTIAQEFTEKYLLATIPPLRERKEDLSQIFDYLISKYNRSYVRNIEYFDKDLISFINSYHWPGNIDELMYNLEPIFLIADQNKRELTLADLFINQQQFFRYIFSSATNDQQKSLESCLGKLKEKAEIFKWSK